MDENNIKQIFSNSSIEFAEVVKKKPGYSLVSCSANMLNNLDIQNDSLLPLPLETTSFFSSIEQVNWTDSFNKVLKDGKEISFEYDCLFTNRYFLVKIYSYKKDHLMIVFSDITYQLEVKSLKNHLSTSDTLSIDYTQITEYVRLISGAKFCVCNSYDKTGKVFVTKAISGNIEIVNKVVSMMGIKLIGHEWNNIKKYKERPAGKKIIRYNRFSDLADAIFPEKAIDFMVKLAKIGTVYRMVIEKDGIMIGDFTMIFEVGDMLKNRRVLEDFAAQYGLLVAQTKISSALYKSEELFKSLFSQAPIGIAIINLNTYETFNINQHYADIIGRSIDELVNTNWQEITHPDDIALDLEYTNNILNGDFSTKSIEKRYIKPDHSYVWVEMSIVPIYDTDNIISHHIILVEDITYRKKIMAKNEYLSNHDELTGLYNRHFFQDELRRLDTRRNYPLSIIFADVNGLKITNDAYGHHFGDMLISRIADIIKSECRRDEILSRVGGDEFIILLPKTSKKQAQVLIDRIKRSLDRGKMDELVLSVSLGSASKRVESENIEGIINQAEQNMYKNKLLISQPVKETILDNMMESLYTFSDEEFWHCQVISNLSKLFAESLGFTVDEIENQRLTGLFHDVGKVGINLNSISSSDPLTVSDRKTMKRHSEIGYQILSAIHRYSHIANLVLSHHERWDGKGYPNKLKGEDIPIGARMLCIVDAYEAMTAHRPYRSNIKSKEEAIKEIQHNAGTQFDPNLIDPFIKIITNYKDPRPAILLHSTI